MFNQQLITQGVPRESVLRPLCFLLSVIEIPLQDSSEGPSLFADDATESAHGTDVQSVECELRIKSDKC